MSMSNREIAENILADGPSYVGHKREDILPFLEYAATKCAAAGQTSTLISELLLGVSRAPIGQQCYHERLQLMQVVEAIDEFESAIATINQPAN